MAKFKFEDSMQKLEDLVGVLEDGDLTLEESLAKYESGIKIYKQCVSLLDGIEKKIKILTKVDDGEMQTKDFQIEDSK
ncbi:MAG: exodeoxyribonuclease VII small subunit [Candidatus Anammoxibacter sp.]